MANEDNLEELNAELPAPLEVSEIPNPTCSNSQPELAGTPASGPSGVEPEPLGPSAEIEDASKLPEGASILDDGISSLLTNLGLEDVNDQPPEINDSLKQSEYNIEGCVVKFPYIAYECQKEMMKMLIKGAQEKENCLLESPTGTGKTAALLCGLLAWQSKFEEDEKDRYSKWEQERQQDENDESPSPTKKYRGDDDPSQQSPSKRQIIFEKKVTPTIYYATRTHSQIKGVIKQLGLTSYRDVPMGILASRKQCCINPVALDSQSMETTCQKFRNAFNSNSIRPTNDENENQSNYCQFYHGTLQESDFKKPDNDANKTWDIEDLKISGKERGCCPYEELRPLQKHAKIVFCTYNHVLHKHIRKSLKIKVEGNIFVLDEAHNIEDTCRSIASFSEKALTDKKVKMIIGKLEEALGEHQHQRPSERKSKALAHLTAAFKRLLGWLQTQLKRNALGFYEIFENKDEKIKVLKRDVSSTLIDELSRSRVQFGPNEIHELWSDYFILEDLHRNFRPDRNDPLFRVDPETMKVISNILFALNKFFKKDPNSGKFVNLNGFGTFLIKIRRETSQASASTMTPPQQSADQPKVDEAINIEIYSRSIWDEDIELHLICLDPAIIFQEMSSARSIIVTSGTLSPTESFSTELNTIFHHQLSAEHVIAANRIFTSVITSRSFSEPWLRFNFDSYMDESKFKYHQEHLFSIITTISENIPHGILVFFASKRCVRQMKSKWAENGILERLQEIKHVFFEHENPGTNDFNQMMISYREKVEDPDKGAILFAYMRGRISEGVDFKDNQARAVITVGIPFLPYKNSGIIAKREFNRKKAEDNPAYLNGQAWYDASSFRAINQAFGRCVRHLNDWGAIVIVDERFQNKWYKDYLSKWVIDSLNATWGTTGDLKYVQPKLKKFAQRFS